MSKKKKQLNESMMAGVLRTLERVPKPEPEPISKKT